MKWGFYFDQNTRFMLLSLLQMSYSSLKRTFEQDMAWVIAQIHGGIRQFIQKNVGQLGITFKSLFMWSHNGDHDIQSSDDHSCIDYTGERWMETATVVLCKQIDFGCVLCGCKMTSCPRCTHLPLPFLLLSVSCCLMTVLPQHMFFLFHYCWLWQHIEIYFKKGFSLKAFSLLANPVHVASWAEFCC